MSGWLAGSEYVDCRIKIRMHFFIPFSRESRTNANINLLINCQERCVIVEHVFVAVAVALLLLMTLTYYVALCLTRIDKRTVFIFVGSCSCKFVFMGENVKHVGGVGAC